MAHQGWRIGSIVLAASLVLAGCSSDESPTSASAPPPSSGGSSTGDPAPAPAPAPTAPATGGDATPVTANTAPQVAGAPTGIASLGEAWSFQPSGTDAEGDALTWSISGKPTDATFSPATGQLSWTPSASGTWSDIVITATDSRGASASLPAFSLLVAAPQQVAGSATLSWDIPQQYTDGGALLPEDQIAGYRVYHGTSEAQLDEVVPVNDATTVTYTVQGLTSGTHYFAVSAVSVNGAEGQRSEILSKSVM